MLNDKFSANSSGSFSEAPRKDDIELQELDGNFADGRYEEEPSSESYGLKHIKKIYNGSDHPSDDPPRMPEGFLRRLETYPFKIYGNLSRKAKILILMGYYFIWLLVLNIALTPYLSHPGYSPDVSQNAISVPCGSDRRIWRGENDKCGLNADRCHPFNSTITIRCPAFCDYAKTYSSLPVGNQTIIYRNFVVGGGPDTTDNQFATLPYRADSFPCGAAINAGLISSVAGGCVTMQFTGPQMEFPATSESIGFDSFYPQSFRFLEPHKFCENCNDPRVMVALLSISFGILATYFDIGGILGYWTTCIAGFWVLILSFDPPSVINPIDRESVPKLISLGFKRLLPLCFTLAVIWHFICSHTLSQPSSQVCKTFIWYPLFWIGMLNNVTFDRLAIDRFTWADMKAMPGSIITTLILFIATLVCGCIQSYQLWKAATIKYYIWGYGILNAAIIMLSQIPGLQVRLHHYIIGMVLLPGTRTKGWTAYIFQGMLLGLIVNGIARWGFSSIEETDLSLLRDDSKGRIEHPTFLGYTAENRSISWYSNTNTEIIPRYSLIINDIEVYKGVNTSINIDLLRMENEVFGQMLNESTEMGLNDMGNNANLYIRVAELGKNEQEKRSSYTKAATLIYPEGIFIDAPEGST